MTEDRNTATDPVAADDQDPGNTDIDTLIVSLDADDDVYARLQDPAGHGA